MPDVHLKTLQNRLRNAASWEERQKIIHEIEELYKVICKGCYDTTINSGTNIVRNCKCTLTQRNRKTCN